MRLLLLLTFLFVFTSVSLAADGMVLVKSAHDVKTTADRLENALNNKGMTVFTRIDHAAGAKSVGIDLLPTELVIFGNPKVGSPIMKCRQSVAIDLPQKALIWQDTSGQVWLGYNDPQYLGSRYGIDDCAEKALQKVSGALANFSRAAAAP
jgi:uncharacterized protein (DUF302 family)